MADPRLQDGPYDRGDRTSLSGLTEAEAKEFHGYFVNSFLAFLFIAIVAHFLTYFMGHSWGLTH